MFNSAYSVKEKDKIFTSLLEYYKYRSKRNFCYNIKRYLNWCADNELPYLPIDDTRITKYILHRTDSIIGSSFENEKSTLKIWCNIIDIPWGVSSIQDVSNNATFTYKTIKKSHKRSTKPDRFGVIMEHITTYCIQRGCTPDRYGIIDLDILLECVVPMVLNALALRIGELIAKNP